MRLRMPGHAWLVTTSMVASIACTNGAATLNPLQPRLQADQRLVRLGPTDVGVSVVGTATFSNPSDGEAHLQAFLDDSSGTMELLDTQGTAAHGSPAMLRIRFTPSTASDVTATLHVQHDAETDDQGNRTLQVALIGTANPIPDCDDGNPCTADFHDSDAPSRCSHVPIRSDCDDGDPCTTGDMCMGGRCVGHARACGDGVACTEDHCDPVTGACLHTTINARCDDGDSCTSDTCAATGCEHGIAPDGTLCGEVSCVALPICVDGACVTSSAPDGYPCEDGDACSSGDVCQSRVCVRGPIRSELRDPVLIHQGPQVTPVPILLDGGTHNAHPADAGTSAEPPPPLLTGAIGGHWPVSVEALLPSPPGEGPSGIVVWRGTDESGLAAGCGVASAGCMDAPPCSQPANATLSLHASSVDNSGAVLWDTVLDVAAVHHVIANPTGPLTPPGTVAAASAAADSEGHIWVAAMIAFSSQCACVFDDQPPPPDGSSSGNAGAPMMETCLPDGDALAVFQLRDRHFILQDTAWLGAPDGASTNLAQSMHGPERRRLVDVAADDTGVDVTTLLRQMPVSCPIGGCPRPITALWTRYRPSVDGLLLVEGMREGIGIGDVTPLRLETQRVGGQSMRVVMWERMPDGGGCNLFPSPRMAGIAMPAAGSTGTSSMLSTAFDAIFSDDGATLVTYSNVGVQRPQTGTCEYQDHIDWLPSGPEPGWLVSFVATDRTAQARMATVRGRLLAARTTEDLSLELWGSATGPVENMGRATPPVSMALLIPDAPPVIGSTSDSAAVVTMGTLTGASSAQRAPAMILNLIGCGQQP